MWVLAFLNSVNKTSVFGSRPDQKKFKTDLKKINEMRLLIEFKKDGIVKDDIAL